MWQGHSKCVSDFTGVALQPEWQVMRTLVNSETMLKDTKGSSWANSKQYINIYKLALYLHYVYVN